MFFLFEYFGILVLRIGYTSGDIKKKKMRGFKVQRLLKALIRCCCSCTREVLMLKPLVPFVKERHLYSVLTIANVFAWCDTQAGECFCEFTVVNTSISI